MTRAELLRHALSQALRKVHAGPQKLKLDEEAPMRPLAPGSGPHDKRETLKAKPEK